VRQIDVHDANGAQPRASWSVDNVGARAILYFQQFHANTGNARHWCALPSDMAAGILGCDYISTLFQHAYCASPAADAACSSAALVLC
jgi:hypothetical protein